MKVEIKGTELVITISANFKDPRPSASGKSRVVASTKGNHDAGVKVLGKDLIVGVNAYIDNGG